MDVVADAADPADLSPTAHRRRLDVAGLAVEVVGPSDAYLDCAISRLGTEPTENAPDVHIDLRADRPAPPAAARTQEVEGFHGAEADGRMWIGRDHAALDVRGSRVVVGGPIDDAASEDLFDDLLQFGVATAMAGPDRILVHGAVVARGDEALLLVGRSGVGKSTLAAAALIDGWDLLGDDLALVHPHASMVRAVRRPPMVPADIAEAHGLIGVPERSARGRLRLPAAALAPGSRRLIGLVAVEHGDAGSIEDLEPGDVETLDDALAGPPFRGVIRRQFAAGAALIDRPIVLLRHAADPEVRVERAQTLLLEALRLCQADGDQ